MFSLEHILHFCSSSFPSLFSSYIDSNIFTWINLFSLYNNPQNIYTLYYSPYFAVEETGTVRLNNFLKVIELVSGGAGRLHFIKPFLTPELDMLSICFYLQLSFLES